MMASAQVVETSVNTNNSPSQDYTTNPDDHSNHNNIIIIRDDMMLESLASFLREMAKLRNHVAMFVTFAFRSSHVQSSGK